MKNVSAQEEGHTTKLIVGLGNPGMRYRKNRHNIGAQAVESIAHHYKAPLALYRSLKSRVGAGEVEGAVCSFAFPQTYMNLSGEAVARLLKNKHSSPKNMLVIYDDLDLELGVLRFKRSGSAAGHHGLESIIATLGTNEFNRLRLGIGRPDDKDVITDYVLSNFSREEYKIVTSVIERSIEACALWVTSGIEPAMNTYNSKIT